MRALVSRILRFRFLVLVLAALVVISGVFQLRDVPVDLLPEFAPPSVEIQTEALGLSAEEVEQLITVPLEQNLLNGVAWVERIGSESLAGLSSITLIFAPGTDLYRARQMVAERLSQATAALPRVSKGPVMLLPKSTTGRVLVVKLSSKTLSAIEMSVLARWTIAPRLMGVPGVANVAVWGMRDRQLQVQVDPERMLAYQVSLLQVLASAANALWVSTLSFVEASTPGNAGFIETPQQRMGMQHISPIVSPKSLSDVAVQGRGIYLINEARVDLSRVAKKEGAVRLGDVADVVESHQPMIGDAVASDGANLLLVIEKAPASDTVRVTRGVEDALATLRPGLGDIEIDSTVFRPATFIAMAQANLTWALLMACGVIALMAGLFFGWRGAVISLVTIPLCIIAPGLVLYARGATLNTMALAGWVLAIGVIVDDLIVDLGNMARSRRQPHDHGGSEMPRSPATVVLEALPHTRGAMLFATVICVLAALPVLGLRGTAGGLFQPLAASHVLAVLASACVALTVTPALCALLLSRVSDVPLDRSAPALMRRLEPGYDRLLRRFIARPRTAYWMMAVLAAVGLGAAVFLRPAVLPAFKERDLLIRLEAPPGTSHPEMVRLVRRIADELRATQGVRNASALVGRAVSGDRAVGINAAEVLVNLDPTAPYDATVARVETAMAGYPGLHSDVSSYLREIGRRVDGEASAPIIVRLYGHDWTTLRAKAEELRQSLSAIDRVGDVELSLPVEEPTLEVDVDLEAAQRHGISPGNVRRAASTLLNGTQVGSLFQEQKVFDVVVWSTPETRGNLADIRNLMLDSPFFKVPVRLHDVAQLRLVPRPSLIRHEDVSRYVDIGLHPDGHAARSVMADVQSRVRQFQFPLEYHATVFAAHEEQQATRTRLVAVSAIVAIGILLLLQAAFESWGLAIVSFVTLPLALVGGGAALAMVGGEGVSLAAVFGLLTVFGVAVRNQIVLIRRLRQLARGEGKSSGVELILQGAHERSSPIVMTAVTITLALLPLLLMGDVPGFELLRPMAVVVVGGMITCALVDLFLVPALYFHLVKAPSPSSK